jgi:hypothetical protein
MLNEAAGGLVSEIGENDGAVPAVASDVVKLQLAPAAFRPDFKGGKQ